MIDRNKTQIIEKEKTEFLSYRMPGAKWGAISSGVIMVIMFQLMLGLLGSTIGLSMINPREGAENLQSVGIGAMVWWLISGLIAFFSGGWIASRLTGVPRPVSGVLHGLIVWGTTCLIMFAVLTGTLGAIIGGGFNLIQSGGKAVAGAAPEIAQTIGQNVNLQNAPGGQEIGQIQEQIRQLLAQRGANADSAQALPQIMGAVGNLATASPQEQNAAREALINQLTINTQMSAVEARSTVDQWSGRLQQARQQVRQVGQEAGKAVEGASDIAATGALASFFMLLLSGIAAGWGGYMGSPHWSEEQIV